MRQVKVERLRYSPMKVNFKKFIKSLGFVWTGRYPEPIEWKSGSTIIRAVWTPLDDPKEGTFTITGSQEVDITSWIVENIGGIEFHDEMKRQKEYDEELKDYKPDFSQYETNKAPQSFIDFKKGEWEEKLQKKRDELYVKYMDSNPINPSPVTTNVNSEIKLGPTVDDIIDNLLGKPNESVKDVKDLSEDEGDC